MKTKTNPMENTVRQTYSSLNKQVDSILRAEGQTCRLTFSMFETVDYGGENGDWVVKTPDFTSTVPLHKGKVRFVARYEEYRGLHAIKNPTWKDALLEANAAASGDHIFLESISFEKQGDEIVAEMFFGS